MIDGISGIGGVEFGVVADVLQLRIVGVDGIVQVFEVCGVEDTVARFSKGFFGGDSAG